MKNSFLKTAFFVSLVMLFTKFLGFFRDILVAAKFGTTYLTDAYVVSQSITNIFVIVILQALNATFIPLYIDSLNNKTKKETGQFFRTIFFVSIVFSLFVTILAAIFAEPIVNIFAPSFEGETLRLTVKLTRIVLLTFPLMTIVILYNSLLQSHNNIAITSAMVVPQSLLLIIVLLFFAEKIGIVGYSIAVVTGILLQIPIQLIFVKRLKLKYERTFNFRNEDIQKLGILIIPTIIGSSIQQVNTIVDRMLASKMVEGSISALNFSNRLNMFILNILVLSVVTAFYPRISDFASKKNKKGLIDVLKTSLVIVMMTIVPVTVGFVFFSDQIVVMLYGRGVFDATSVEMTAYALQFYAIGIIGHGCREVLSRVFYAYKDTKTPMINAAIGMALNIVLNIILSKHMGIGGLALATSIAAIFTAFLMFISLNRKIGSINFKEIFIILMKILVASSIMIILMKLLFNYLYFIIGQNISLIIAGVFGILIYCSIIILMKIEETNTIIKFIKSKLKITSSRK